MSNWTYDIEDPEFLDTNIIAIGLREKRSTTKEKLRRKGKGSRGGSSSRYPFQQSKMETISEADIRAYSNSQGLLER